MRQFLLFRIRDRCKVYLCKYRKNSQEAELIRSKQKLNGYILQLFRRKTRYFMKSFGRKIRFLNSFYIRLFMIFLKKSCYKVWFVCVICSTFALANGESPCGE